MLEAQAKTSSPFLHQDWALKLSPEYQIVLQDEHIEAVKVYEQLAAAFDALVGSLAPIVGDAQVGGRLCGGRESLTRGRGSSHSQWKGQAVSIAVLRPAPRPRSRPLPLPRPRCATSPGSTASALLHVHTNGSITALSAVQPRAALLHPRRPRPGAAAAA